MTLNLTELLMGCCLNQLISLYSIALQDNYSVTPILVNQNQANNRVLQIVKISEMIIVMFTHKHSFMFYNSLMMLITAYFSSDT